MWMVNGVVSTVGMLLNIYMLMTWVISGRKAFRKTRLQLKNCVFGGIVYFMVRKMVYSNGIGAPDH
jgi:hypothetical protein